MYLTTIKNIRLNLKKHRKSLFFLMAVFCATSAYGQVSKRDSLAMTPPMGWMSWNQYKEIIAIDQDKMGIPAKLVTEVSGCRIFVRPLTGNRHAVAILNAGDKAQKVSLPFKSIGVITDKAVRDVWVYKILAKKTSKWVGLVGAHETKVFVLE